MKSNKILPETGSIFRSGAIPLYSLTDFDSNDH